MRPEKNTYPEYYENYIPLVTQPDVKSAFIENEKETLALLADVTPNLENYAYADQKWTIKEVLNHIIDTERIFAYRALRFARNDAQQPLPYDENEYIKHVDLSHRDLNNLINEFRSVRAASITLFESFTETELLRIGNTAGGKCSVLAIGYTICGHAKHHLHVIRERYLKK
ncbi:MAG: DinB family protein [Sphingobacteriaceae bacterium]|nr:DinB family protein [Sphingobacteriaceae bacterium]